MSSSSSCVSTVRELRLESMRLPPVVIMVVVLLFVLYVRIAYPVALVPLCLHPPSDCAKMFVCVIFAGYVAMCIVEYV